MNTVKWPLISLACVMVLVAGCGMAGTYKADARLVPGKAETGESGYTLDEIRARIAQGNRTLTLQSGGRFVWNTGSATNEGVWRVEGNTLILREDIYDGNPIGSALQKDRQWVIRNDNEIISGSYSAYNIEEFYSKQ
jgi:hypothetical protein